MKLVHHDRKIRIDFYGSMIGTGKWAEGTAVGFNRKKKGQRCPGVSRGAHGQRRASRVDTHPWYRYAEALPALTTAISKSGSRHRKGGTT